jgi:hypothetical protein
VWFYLTWIDSRVKGQIAENAAKLTNDTLNYKCENPCQSNSKPIAGGCCDGEMACTGGGGGMACLSFGGRRGGGLTPGVIPRHTYACTHTTLLNTVPAHTMRLRCIVPIVLFGGSPSPSAP